MHQIVVGYIKHLITDPKGLNGEFCSSRPSVLPAGEGNIDAVEGKQNSLFPAIPVIKIKLRKNRLLDATADTRICRGFKEHCPITCKSKLKVKLLFA